MRRDDLSPGVYLAPSIGKHVIPLNLDDDQMLKIAFLQQDIAIRHRLNLCVGGDVELTEVDEHGISVRKLGEYPDKSVVAEQICGGPSTERALAAA